MDTDTPAITVAIPFYAGKEYLRRAIDSVRAQADPAWELVVCDDAGPEAGIDRLVASYGDLRLRYHRNPSNLGMAGNWNQCLDLAQTDLVVLLHADDELLDGYVALMRRAAAAHPKAVAYFCEARIIDERGVSRFSFPDAFKALLIPKSRGPLVLRGREALAMLLRGNFIFCPTVCYRCSQLGARRFRPEWHQVQDLELFSRLLLEGETLVGLRQEQYAYRRHSDNATARHTASLLRFEEEQRLYEELERAGTERRWMAAARVARRKTILKLNLAYCTLADCWQGRWDLARRKAALLWQMAGGNVGTLR